MPAADASLGFLPTSDLKIAELPSSELPADGAAPALAWRLIDGLGEQLGAAAGALDLVTLASGWLSWRLRRGSSDRTAGAMSTLRSIECSKSLRLTSWTATARAVGDHHHPGLGRVCLQPGKNPDRVAGAGEGELADHDHDMDVVKQVRMLDHHVARKVDHHALEGVADLFLQLIEG